MQLRFDEPNRSVSFFDPQQVHSASTPAQAWKILAQAQSALEAGFAVAGYLSYEFGYSCLDQAQPTVGQELLLLGFFDPRNVVIREGSPSAQTQNSCDFKVTSPFLSRVSPLQYESAIRAIQQLLLEGELYQLNYTVPFDFDFAGSPRQLYQQLGTQSQAPYRAFLSTDAFALVSLSPELFLEIDETTLRTKPMKGTAHPSNEQELSNAKNRAEHVMIVDLLRNDVGQVCDHVNVEAAFTIERYPTFSTMTSTICGTRRAATSLADIFRALFPCGSVVGAPKYAAMREIAKIEAGPRGAYCGSVGYLLPPGKGRWNVAIRTMQLDLAQGRGRLDLGGGIVADSKPEAEWQEILTKGRLFAGLADFKEAWRGTPSERP